MTNYIMSDRECRDLSRGLVKKSPKKNRNYATKDYILGHGSLEDNENLENKPIIAQSSTHPKNTSQKPFQNKWINERVLLNSKDSSANYIPAQGSSLSHLLQSNVTPCTLQMQLDSNSLKVNETESEEYSTQSYHYELKSWKSVKEKVSNKYEYEKSDTDHPVYHTISLINGTINRMDLGEMKNRCKELNLDCNGRREAVKRRLKEYYKTEKLIQAGLLERRSSDERNSDFFIVIGKINLKYQKDQN